MTINDFRGQVKIADVQAAFNEIVNRINSAIDTYKSAQELEDIDYTKGSPKLSSAGYTLTVGGLKSILNAYSGCTIGARAYKMSEGESVLSDGLHIRNGRPYRINAQIVQGGDEPSVTPTVSQSFYSYISKLRQGLYDTYYTGVYDQSETKVSGYNFNHLNSIPFEFDKVYAFDMPSYAQYDPTHSLGGFYKFAYYNKNLDKVIPCASFSDNSLAITGITLLNSGEPARVSTYSVSQTASQISQPSNMHINTVYVQKVKTSSGIKLYAVGQRQYYNSQEYYSVIASDTEGSSAFSELLENCNYIMYMGANSNTFYAGNYYEISGTLDQITDISQLGEAKHYSNNRPAGTWGDASEIYYDLESEKLYPKSSISGDGTVTEVQQVFGESETSGELDSNSNSNIIITASSNSENAYKSTSETENWSCDVRNVGKSSLILNSSTLFQLENISFTVSITGTSGTVNVYAGDSIIHSVEIQDGDSKDVSINVDEIVSSNLKIEIERLIRVSNNATFSLNKLKVTGKWQVYAFVTGDTETPNYNLIRLYKLNWDSGDIVLNGIEGIQLEGLDNAYITTQNRKIQPKGYSDWDNINNSKSGKFVAYTTGFHPYGGWRSHSSITFEGIEIDGLGVHSNDPDRHHYRAQALSLIYIPKGFTVTDSKSGACGRYVYKCDLHK